MIVPSALLLLALQPGSAPSSAGEESLVWTEQADPDPNYVPPPPTAEELAARRAQRIRIAQQPFTSEEYRRAFARADAQLDRARQAIQISCDTVRQAIGDHPACNQ